MVTVKVRLQTTGEPVTRIPVAFVSDVDRSTTKPVLTDPLGEARFAVPAGPGKILVDGVEHYHGVLSGQIVIDLSSGVSEGAVSEAPISAMGLVLSLNPLAEAFMLLLALAPYLDRLELSGLASPSFFSWITPLPLTRHAPHRRNRHVIPSLRL